MAKDQYLVLPALSAGFDATASRQLLLRFHVILALPIEGASGNLNRREGRLLVSSPIYFD